MSHELQSWAFISDKLIDEFTCYTPTIDSQDLVKFRNSQPWKLLTDTFKTKSPGQSNEMQFKDVLIEFGKLPTILSRLKPISTADKSRWTNVRISVQGAIPMETWDPSANWAKKSGGCTPKGRELKPDLMSLVVEKRFDSSPQLGKHQIFRANRPETISPPPVTWTAKSNAESNEMQDHQFPIVECKYPVWEIADTLWELKRGNSLIEDAKVYLDCALKATEVLRYQWSRRFIYFFLHCGKFMRLLRFDRAGLVASRKVDITLEPNVFLHCLLAVFSNEPSELGYPCAKEIPRHVPAQGKTHHAIEIDSNILCLDEQIVGPWKDHLVGRGTVTWKAHLMSDDPEKDGKFFCIKVSWAQMERKHEGHFIKKLLDAGVENVVKLLAFSPEKAGEGNNTQLGSKELKPLKCIEKYHYHLQNQEGTLNRDNKLSEHCLGTSVTPNINQTPASARREDREFRLSITAWVEQAFDKACANHLSGLSSGFSSNKPLLAMLSLWRKSFMILDGVTKAQVLHRDISFQNMRVNENNEPIICDFDMAIEPNSTAWGLRERTGTVEFMAIGILNGESHRAFHDCESVYWLCSIALLRKCASYKVKRYIEAIMDSSKELFDLGSIKTSFMAYMQTLGADAREERIMEDLQPKNIMEKDLVKCLINLTNYFFRHTHASPEQTAGCFKACSDIIDTAVDRAKYKESSRANEEEEPPKKRQKQ